MTNVNSKNLVLKYEEMKHFSTENKKMDGRNLQWWRERGYIDSTKKTQSNVFKCGLQSEKYFISNIRITYQIWQMSILKI